MGTPTPSGNSVLPNTSHLRAASANSTKPAILNGASGRAVTPSILVRPGLRVTKPDPLLLSEAEVDSIFEEFENITAFPQPSPVDRLDTSFGIDTVIKDVHLLNTRAES
ncbi:hypothetical protein HDU93_006797 [Gonapodya sp. JEL0774]|nr:hypothetical protein HDU93_006797 [Gonapodya sp. JEL0774]